MGSVDSQETPGRAGEDAPGSVIVGYHQGIAILDLVGEHDLATATEIGFRIKEQAAQGRGVVVSLTETDFIDTSVIRMFFVGDQEMLRRGRRLVVHTSYSESIQRTLELAGVSDRLLCCDALAEAIEFASQCCA